MDHHSASPAHYGGDGGGGPFAPSPEERMHQVRPARGTWKTHLVPRPIAGGVSSVSSSFELKPSLYAPSCIGRAPAKLPCTCAATALSVTSMCSLAARLPQAAAVIDVKHHRPTYRSLGKARACMLAGADGEGARCDAQRAADRGRLQAAHRPCGAGWCAMWALKPDPKQNLVDGLEIAPYGDDLACWTVSLKAIGGGAAARRTLLRGHGMHTHVHLRTACRRRESGKVVRHLTTMGAEPAYVRQETRYMKDTGEMRRRPTSDAGPRNECQRQPQWNRDRDGDGGVCAAEGHSPEYFQRIWPSQWSSTNAQGWSVQPSSQLRSYASAEPFQVGIVPPTALLKHGLDP